MAARSISSMYEGRALLAVSRGPRVRGSGGVVGVPGLLAAAAFALTKADATAAGVTLCWAGRRRSSAWMASPSARASSEEHTSELQSLMRISYAVFCLNNKRGHELIVPTRPTVTTCSLLA